MEKVELNLIDIEAVLGKSRTAFTKADIRRFVKMRQIRHVNFMYAGGDGRLKSLNFVIHSEAYLDEILSCGERVDGSSLFSYIEASSSDLYVKLGDRPRRCGERPRRRFIFRRKFRVL